MTLKQFFQLAGGVLVGIIFYATPLHPLIKWPLVIFFSLLGAALAFLPFEERPLEKWIIAFFRSVYSPTLFTWKQSTPSKFFQEEQNQNLTHQVIAPQGQEALNNYLATTNAPSSIFQRLEEGEKSFLSKMGDLFAPGSPQAGILQFVNTPAPAQKPVSILPQIPTQAPVPPQAPASVSTPVSGPIAPMISTPQDSTAAPTETVAPSVVKGPVKVPQTTAVEVTPIAERPKFVVQENTAPLVAKEEELEKPYEPTPVVNAQQAVFSPDAAPPSPPTIINTLSGQVMDSGGKIIQGAILEIRDISGRPVRALRTNMLGHFLIVTPLVNGGYEIITEKDGYEFDPLKFEAEGTFLPPIAIKAKAKAAVVVPTGNEFTSSQALQA